jgi:hypothetical protein
VHLCLKAPKTVNKQLIIKGWPFYLGQVASGIVHSLYFKTLEIEAAFWRLIFPRKMIFCHFQNEKEKGCEMNYQVSRTGLPDFSSYNIPKTCKNIQNCLKID